MLDFAGRVAIVTGSGRGLGRAHALMLAARGCRVVVNDIPAEGGGPGPAHDVVRKITAAGASAIAIEHSVVTDAARIVADTVAEFGRLDILVNNAGNVDHGLFGTLAQAQYQQQIDIHLLAAVALCRAAWPHLVQSGSGRIVNTTSGAIYGGIGVTNYSAAKGALMGFTRSLGLEGKAVGINVNCMGPNGKTRLTDSMADSFQPLLQESFGAERIAAFVAWLCHQDCTITNEIFEVGGGMVTRVQFARQPFVHAGADTPEAWAAKADTVVANAPLTPMAEALSLLMAEIGELYPQFDFSRFDLLETVE